MSFQANSAGINVGKRYGARHIGTVEGVTNSKGSVLVDMVIHLNSKDLTGPHTVKIPPFCKIEGILEVCKEAWPASTNFTATMAGNLVTHATAPTLGTAKGFTSLSMNATPANLVNATDGWVEFKVTGPVTSAASGKSAIVVSLARI